MIDILKALKMRGGYWKYEGGRYLAKLTSGKVSDVYVNCSKITGNTPVMEAASFDLLCKLRDRMSDDQKIAKGIKPCRDLTDWIQPPVYVCGPAFGGITLAYSIALGIGAETIFTEPVHDAFEEDVVDPMSPALGPQRIVYTRKTGQQLNFEIPEGATVLFVTDAVITGKSTYAMVEAFELGAAFLNTKVLPYLLCLVNRSGSDEFSHISFTSPFKIISLAEINAKTWDTTQEAEADLRRNGEIAESSTSREPLEAVCPKDQWDLLTGGI